jgi:protein CpxP
MERRRFFKQAGIAALVGGLAAGVGFRAFAHRGGFDSVDVEHRLDRMLKHFYVEVDATEEQQRRLAPIVKDAVRDLMPMREKLHAGRERAIELLAQDDVDRGAVESLRAEHLRLADEASQRLVRAVADAAEVLTPAQRKQLAAHMARRHARWAHG